MTITQRITSCLWFEGQAEEAATFYVSVFNNSRITGVTHNGDAGPGPKGSALVVAFELDGQSFTALNGGPAFTFNEAVSLIVSCETQDEVDTYWEKLTSGGGSPSQCGWLKDRFGLSWQSADRAHRHAAIQGRAESAAGHASHVADDKDRYRAPERGLRGLTRQGP